jgi:hypothetical protein
MHHLVDDPLPEGVYDEAEAAIVRYAQKSTRLEPIDDITYGNLAQHFTTQQIIDICMTVGLSNLVNRFHATFQTDMDAITMAEAKAGDQAAGGACPIRRPKPPGK